MMKHIRLVIIGVLVFVARAHSSPQVLHREDFPSPFIEESKFQRVKRDGEGANMELSRVKRLPGPRPEHEIQDNTRDALTRVKRIDVEQPNRVKRNAAPPKSSLDDGRIEFLGDINTITQEEEDWPKVDENRKRMYHTIEERPDPPKGMHDMKSFRGIHRVAPPKTTITDDRIRKFISKRVEITEKNRNVQ